MVKRFIRQKDKEVISKERDYLLDVIRAVSICLVFVWHVQPFKFIVLKDYSSYFLLNTVLVQFYLEVALIAVPAFFTVSLYLFYKKQDTPVQYFTKRIMRLSKLYLFWVSVQFVIYYLVSKTIPPFSFQILKAGGPSLPVVGDSVFYFLYDLIFLTVFAFAFVKCSGKVKNIISIIIFVLSMVTFEAAIFTDKLPQDIYSLWCYLYIVPLAYQLSERKDLFLKNKYKILAAYFLFIFHDIIIMLYLTQHLTIRFPPYARVSIILGILTLFAFIMDSRISHNKIISLLSRYSLGIFALHKYFQFLASSITTDYGHACLLGVGIELRPLVIFLVTSLLTLFCTYLTGRTCLRQFVS